MLEKYYLISEFKAIIFKGIQGYISYIKKDLSKLEYLFIKFNEKEIYDILKKKFNSNSYKDKMKILIYKYLNKYLKEICIKKNILNWYKIITLRYILSILGEIKEIEFLYKIFWIIFDKNEVIFNEFLKEKGVKNSYYKKLFHPYFIFNDTVVYNKSKLNFRPLIINISKNYKEIGSIDVLLDKFKTNLNINYYSEIINFYILTIFIEFRFLMNAKYYIINYINYKINKLVDININYNAEDIKYLENIINLSINIKFTPAL